jgi:ribonuclease VapC
MFVDASAIVAMLTREAEADLFLDLVEAAPAPITSAIAIFEAVLGICRKRQSSIAHAQDDVWQFLTAANIRVVDISEAAVSEALSAFAQYGKGRGHPAQLNLGDCFAYAVAKLNDAPLLFKGDDFSKTDIALP